MPVTVLLRSFRARRQVHCPESEPVPPLVAANPAIPLGRNVLLTPLLHPAATGDNPGMDT